MGCHLLLQRIFLIQRLNLGLLHLGQILYHPSPQGSPWYSEVLIISPSLQLCELDGAGG